MKRVALFTATPVLDLLCSTRHARTFLLSTAILLHLLSARTTTYAGSAQWDLTLNSGDWNAAINWAPATVPNGLADMATFDFSNTTGVFLSANTEVNGIVFDAGASAFAVTAGSSFTLTISGVGITNNSGVTQNFVAAVDGAGHDGFIQFKNSATAGSGTFFTNNGGVVAGALGGATQFYNTATAGNGTFTNNGAAVSGATRGFTQFLNSSTAGNGTFINNGGAGSSNNEGGATIFYNTSTAGNGDFTNNGATVNGTGGGFTVFYGASSAANGTFTNNGGAVSGAGYGYTSFFNSSTAGNGTFTNNGGTVSGGNGGITFFASTSSAAGATLIANGGVAGGDGGSIRFLNDSTGGTSRVEVFGNGNLDISLHNAPGVALGSIEGTGNVFLGGRNLSVGNNNLDTTFSGVIQNGGAGGGVGGSLTKIGTGTLALSGANIYTGGTAINAGALLVNNASGSGTGIGAVQVNAGTLGGTGTIAGTVTIGTGNGPGAHLSPGLSPGTLTIQSTLTLNSDATYKFELNSSTATTDEIIAHGVILNGAQFSFTDLGSGTLTPGTVLTAIDNTAVSLITGAFINLPDHSMFTYNGNTFEVNYEGGDGNDLTLTSTHPSGPSVPDGGATWLLFGLSSILLLGAARYSQQH